MHESQVKIQYGTGGIFKFEVCAQGGEYNYD